MGSNIAEVADGRPSHKCQCVRRALSEQRGAFLPLFAAQAAI
jgi:hypothetical protein